MSLQNNNIVEDPRTLSGAHPAQDFNPTFYNPFEIKRRKRTSRAQFRVLEKTFVNNSKPSSKTRQELAEKLSMTPRGVQVWFQNRRAKQKQQSKKPSHDKSPTMLSASSMTHSRSQSSCSSSQQPSQVNHLWCSDTSTVNDEEEEGLLVNQLEVSAPPVTSHDIGKQDLSWIDDNAMVDLLNHQTRSLMKDNNHGHGPADSTHQQCNLDAAPWNCLNPSSQQGLNTNCLNAMTSQPYAMGSLNHQDVPHYNGNVADWVKSMQLVTETANSDTLFAGILDPSAAPSSSSSNMTGANTMAAVIAASSAVAPAVAAITKLNSNVNNKRNSMPLGQNQAYWANQQMMRRFSESNNQNLPELELVNPYINANSNQHLADMILQ